MPASSVYLPLLRFPHSKGRKRIDTLVNIPEFLQSSSGEGLALRWKSFAYALIPIFVIAAQLAGYDISKEAFGEAADSIGEAITYLWLLVTAVMHVKGWAERNFRKANKLGAFARK